MRGCGACRTRVSAFEFADSPRHRKFGHAGDELLSRLAVSDQIGYRNSLQAVVFGEIADLWTAHHSNLCIDKPANRRHWLDVAEPAEVDRGFGVARAHQHAAVFGD